jgi:hypothetical protein
MALPGDVPSPTNYGVRVRVTPDTSGNNPPLIRTVILRADTSGGTYSTIATQWGKSLWFHDDVRPLSTGKKFYKAKHTFPGSTDSALIGPVDAEPGNLDETV